MADHSCSRALTSDGRRIINVECSCGETFRVEAANAHAALVAALDRFADHAVIRGMEADRAGR